MIQVYTDELDWWFHYEYRGMNIDVQMDKGICGPESAIARATWLIHDAIEKLDESQA